VLTADTYTSVLPAAQYRAAEATARLVLQASRTDRDKITAVARRNRVAAQQMSEGIPVQDSHQGAVAAGHRPSKGGASRSSAVATVRQPPGNHRPHRTR